MNDLKIPENWSYRVYPVSWDSSANYTGFNPAPSLLLGQPINYGGIMPQGHPANWTPLPSHAGFNFQNLLPWAQPFNHTGMFAQGHLRLYYRRQPSLFISIPITRVFWKPSRMGWSVGPMGWGNNGGRSARNAWKLTYSRKRHRQVRMKSMLPYYKHLCFPALL